MRRGLRRLASENVVRAGVLDADSSVIAGTEAMSKSSKAPGGSSKTVCIESDFSEVGPGLCVDSSGKRYDSVTTLNKLASRDLAEYCIVLGTTLFASTPGFVGVEELSAGSSLRMTPVPMTSAVPPSTPPPFVEGTGEIDTFSGDDEYTCFKFNGYIPFE